MRTPFPHDPSPTLLWTLHKPAKVATAEVRFVPNGVQITRLINGSILMSRIFQTGEEALAWAEEEKGSLLRNNEWAEGHSPSCRRPQGGV